MELGLSVGRSVERPVPHHFILTYLYFIFTLSLFGRKTGLELKDGSGDLTVRQNVLACAAGYRLQWFFCAPFYCFIFYCLLLFVVNRSINVNLPDFVS